jgi:hypothetical protein
MLMAAYTIEAARRGDELMLGRRARWVRDLLVVVDVGSVDPDPIRVLALRGSVQLAPGAAERSGNLLGIHGDDQLLAVAEGEPDPCHAATLSGRTVPTRGRVALCLDAFQMTPR